MKQRARNEQSQQIAPDWAAASERRNKRHVMNRFSRHFFILILTLLILVSVLAGLASWKPWILSFRTMVLRYHTQSTVNYRVIFKPDVIPGAHEASANASYLDELVAAVEPTFTILMETDRPVFAEAQAVLKATIQAHEPGDEKPILFQIEEPIFSDPSSLYSDESTLRSEHVQIVDLDVFRKRAADLNAQLKQTLEYELLLTYSVQFTTKLPAGPITINETASLLIPLNHPVFRMTKTENANPETKPIYQQIHYRVYLDRIPWPFFLVAAILSLTSLLLLLFTTSSQQKDTFSRKLNKMKRLSRGQLIMIGDKAWDPAWCVKVTDFKTMAKAARKLNHPIFCYVDDFSAWPAAYFYSYYGENNFCYLFTQHPDLIEHTFSVHQSDHKNNVQKGEIPIPVLPNEKVPSFENNPPDVQIFRPDQPSDSLPF